MSRTGFSPFATQTTPGHLSTKRPSFVGFRSRCARSCRPSFPVAFEHRLTHRAQGRGVGHHRPPPARPARASPELIDVGRQNLRTRPAPPRPRRAFRGGENFRTPLSRLPEASARGGDRPRRRGQPTSRPGGLVMACLRRRGISVCRKRRFATQARTGAGAAAAEGARRAWQAAEAVRRELRGRAALAIGWRRHEHHSGRTGASPGRRKPRWRPQRLTLASLPGRRLRLERRHDEADPSPPGRQVRPP